MREKDKMKTITIIAGIVTGLILIVLVLEVIFIGAEIEGRQQFPPG
jgi:hypothetical protein